MEFNSEAMRRLTLCAAATCAFVAMAAPSHARIATNGPDSDGIVARIAVNGPDSDGIVARIAVNGPDSDGIVARVGGNGHSERDSAANTVQYK